MHSDHRPQQVHLGPRIDASNFEYRNEGLYAMNGRHFSSKGYKKLAADFAELIVKDLIKIEFTRFKGALGYA